ncbi:hypothetical protein VMCG_03780 [Cytospora schulzeri]|uniref:Uncharacterized protein n=1 Tax=Cytospora schulzeri TaxID=448051 RepID=A0A423WVJ9_9PEZI|nr:hypothetical protein VMCG_03780 [Valsa malicola]
MGLSHDEQPGLELAPVTNPQVAYGEGLEFDPSKPVTNTYDHTLHRDPSTASHQGQYNSAAAYDPYRQSAYLNSTTSGWSPASNGVIPVGGPPFTEKPPGQERSYKQSIRIIDTQSNGNKFDRFSLILPFV